MSFATIDPKNFFTINNYASYNGQIFWSYVHNLSSRQIAQVQILYSTFFSLFPSINTISTTLVPLLAPIYSMIGDFVSTY